MDTSILQEQSFTLIRINVSSRDGLAFINYSASASLSLVHYVILHNIILNQGCTLRSKRCNGEHMTMGSTDQAIHCTIQKLQVGQVE